MIYDFKFRSNEKELMDKADLDAKLLHENLSEIIIINRFTGGTSLTWKGIKKLIGNNKEEVSIADIGSGAGDLIKFLSSKKNTNFKLYGIDIQKEAINFAKQKYPEINEKVNWMTGDYNTFFDKGFKADIIVASLFCHHLDDEEMLSFLKKAYSAANTGIVINDLHRSPIAYYSIKFITQIFSRSPFSRNDAPLSVLRAFKSKEIEKLLQKAGIKNYTISWEWAFRYLIVIKK